ncbi:MAG: hypothetical protein ACRBEE_12430 [Arenicella sp.]
MINVLVVEDNLENLNSRVEYFKSQDNNVLGVTDSDSAIGAIRSLPNFDLVITDIDLKDKAESQSSLNKNGVQLAKWIKSHNFPCYLVGYSAQFGDGQLSDEELTFFDDFEDRSSGAEAIENKLLYWTREAKNIDSKAHYDKQVKHLVEERNIATKEEVKSALELLELSDMFTSGENIIGEYLKSNFELRIFLPEYKSVIRRPFPAWVGFEDESYFIEVVGQPYLYADGATEEDAEIKLKELMFEFYEDLSEVQNQGLSPVLVNLKQCLCALYNDD